MDDDGIEAWIAINRIREMRRAGWVLVGPVAETEVLMAGPDPDRGHSAWRQIGAILRELEDVG
jgi:hypothetical protein